MSGDNCFLPPQLLATAWPDTWECQGLHQGFPWKKRWEQDARWCWKEEGMVWWQPAPSFLGPSVFTLGGPTAPGFYHDCYL